MIAVEQIVALLQAAKLGTPGKDLFAYRTPSTSTIGLTVANNLAGVDIDWETPGFQQGSFQVIARHHDLPLGLALIRRVAGALTIQQPITLPAVAGTPAILLKRCLPRHEPITYPRTDNNLVEHSVNFDFVAVR